MHSTNIPTTILTNFPVVLQGLERRLTARPGLDECKVLVVEKSLGHQVLKASFANTELGLPVKVCRAIQRDLTSREITGVFWMLNKELCSCFRASRLDYLSGRRAGGVFAVAPSRERDGETVMGMCRRLTRLMGRDQDKSRQTKLTHTVLQILTRMSFKLKVGDKTIEGEHLVRLLKPEKVAGGIDGEHKGGKWFIGEIHPELFSLSLNRFTPVGDEIFERSTTGFNVAVRMLAESALRRSTQASLCVERAIRDTGLTETTTRGNARALKRLTRELGELVKLGVLEAFEVIKGKVITTFAAQPPSNHRVRCTTDSKPPSSLHDPSKDSPKTIENKGLGEQVSALVRIFGKMLSTSGLPHQGGEPLELEGMRRGLMELERVAQLS